MDKITKMLGELAVGAIVKAIQAGKSRREALADAAAELRREDVVSDDLWDELDSYVDSTRDFEDNGAGG